VIAEVSLSDTDQDGLTALGITVGKAPNGGTSITGVTGALAGWTFGPVVAAALTGVTGATGAPATTSTQPIAGGINPLNFLATMVPLGDLHKVKILQQDTITTTHNKQATFSGDRAEAGLDRHDRRPARPPSGPTARSRPPPP
jgi:type II secretory pathway component GspD/PulD (secretin)